MKRFIAILCAAFLLAALASGCKKDEPAVLVTEEETTEELWTYPTLPEEEETEPVEPTDAEPGESAAASTTTTTTTSRIPVLSGSASASTSTTTTRSSTTTTTTTTAQQNGGNALNISSQEQALSAFNSAVQKATGGKAGFAKRHMITAQGWVFDPEFLGVIPNLGGLIDPASTLTTALDAALGKGMRTATATKGSANALLENSAFVMSDLNSAAWSASGGVTTVTLNVKDGQTRQEKRLFGNNRSTGTSPIDKGPLGLLAANLYDHMDADKIFGLIKSAFSFLNVEPIDIQENTSQVKFVAKIDSQGRLTELTATYNQTINLRDIRVLNGAQAFKDNKGSSTVTVTYDSFVY